MRLEAHFYFHQTEEKPPPPQVIMVNMQNVDYKILLFSLFILLLSIHCQGRPLSKRTVSEMQLMHNLREHKQVQERQEWLQMRLHGIHNAAARAGGGSVDVEGLRRRRLHPEELSELGDLTSEEIQHALDFLEKLLQSKQS